MGNQRYTLYRRGQQIEAGYGVADVCNQDDCPEKIDRGLDYLCGGTPGGDEFGCGGYFCGIHLAASQNDVPSTCPPCRAKWEKARAEEFAEQLADVIAAMPGVKSAGALADEPHVFVDLDNGGQYVVQVTI